MEYLADIFSFADLSYHRLWAPPVVGIGVCGGALPAANSSVKDAAQAEMMELASLSPRKGAGGLLPN